ARAHVSLGHSLVQKKQFDTAIAEYQMGISLAKDLPEAHCGLGLVLLYKGQLDKALASLRRGHELGAKIKGWPFDLQWLRLCEELVSASDQLPDFLDGKKQPVNKEQRLALAYLCQASLSQPGDKKRYAAVARWYAEAFAADPTLIGDQPSSFRYNA